MALGAHGEHVVLYTLDVVGQIVHPGTSPGALAVAMMMMCLAGVPPSAERSLLDLCSQRCHLAQREQSAAPTPLT